MAVIEDSGCDSVARTVVSDTCPGHDILQEHDLH